MQILFLILIPIILNLNHIYQFEKYSHKYVYSKKEMGKDLCDIKGIDIENNFTNLARLLHIHRDAQQSLFCWDF
jgi:hypothetical protein